VQIEWRNIGKRYQKKWLFRHVNDRFFSNEIIGIVGNNGSGKSTYTQIVSGFLSPSEGELTWLSDKMISVEEIWKHVSWCSPLLELPSSLSVIDVLQLQFQMREVQNTNVSALLDQIELLPHGNKKLEDLSSGMMQRLKLLLAFNTKSDILILDEPASHLDQKWQNWMDQMIVLNAKDKVVFIASNEHPVELKRCTRLIDLNLNDQP
jgi:ABC-type multidrug transport system ATPase subunit